MTHVWNHSIFPRDPIFKHKKIEFVLLLANVRHSNAFPYRKTVLSNSIFGSHVNQSFFLHQWWWIIKVYCWHMKKRDGQIELNKFLRNEWIVSRIIFFTEAECWNKRKQISSTSIFCETNICYVLCVFLLFYYFSVALIVFDFSLSLRQLLPPNCHHRMNEHWAGIPKCIVSSSTIELHRAFMPFLFCLILECIYELNCIQQVWSLLIDCSFILISELKKLLKCGM